MSKKEQKEPVENLPVKQEEIYYEDIADGITDGIDGLPDLDPEREVNPPVLRLIQDRSRDIKELRKDGIEPGEMVNSMTKRSYGISVIMQPIRRKKSRIMFIEKSDEIKCQSFDGHFGETYGECAKCKYSKWTDRKTPPDCTEVSTWLVLIEGDSFPIKVRFQKTSMGASNEITSICALTKLPIRNPNAEAKFGVNPYALKFELKSVGKTHKVYGEYFTFEIRSLGLVDKETFERGKRLSKLFEGMKVEHDKDDGFDDVENPADIQDDNDVSDVPEELLE